MVTRLQSEPEMVVDCSNERLRLTLGALTGFQYLTGATSTWLYNRLNDWLRYMSEAPDAVKRGFPNVLCTTVEVLDFRLNLDILMSQLPSLTGRQKAKYSTGYCDQARICLWCWLRNQPFTVWDNLLGIFNRQREMPKRGPLRGWCAQYSEGSTLIPADLPVQSVIQMMHSSCRSFRVQKMKLNKKFNEGVVDIFHIVPKIESDSSILYWRLLHRSFGISQRLGFSKLPLVFASDTYNQETYENPTRDELLSLVGTRFGAYPWELVARRSGALVDSLLTELREAGRVAPLSRRLGVFHGNCKRK